VNVERALELAKVDLIQTLQLDPRGTYTFAPPALDTTSKTNVAFSLDSLLHARARARTDLFAQQSLVSAASQNVKAAKGGRWPALSLSAGLQLGVQQRDGRSRSRPAQPAPRRLGRPRHVDSAVRPRHDGLSATQRAQIARTTRASS
jgi:outer membrane protein TolC